MARDCGSLSIECSDVAGYVEQVAERISDHLKVLDGLEEVTTRLLADQARVSDSTDEARLLSEQAKAKLDSGRGDRRHDQRFKGLTELVVQLGERMAGFAAAMNQVQTVSSTIETIARKTNMLALECHHRGGLCRRCRPQLRGGRRRGEEAGPRHPRRDQPDRFDHRELTREASAVTSEIKTGVERSRAAQAGFGQISDTVKEVTEIVSMVDRQTEASPIRRR